MNKVQLDREEQKIIAAFEKGHLKPIANSKKEVARLTKVFKAARSTDAAQRNPGNL